MEDPSTIVFNAMVKTVEEKTIAVNAEEESFAITVEGE